MANGDVTKVLIQSTFTIPNGGGRTLTGGASNNKVMVTGEITGSHVDTNGMNLDAVGGARALGLLTIDFIDFDVKSGAGTVQVDEGILNAAFNHSTQEIHTCIDGNTNLTQGNVIVLKFLAIGDSSSPVLA